MGDKILNYKNAFLDFYSKHEVAVSSGVFIFGFVFDLLTLGRIDDLFNLIQQAVYILILGTLLVFEIKIKMGTLTLTERGKKFWDYHDLVVHFLFGSLLSVYTIFYYTSASAVTSFLFILLLTGLMFANEFPQFQKLGLPVRVILYSICVMSYCSFLFPIMIGHVGAIPFWLGFLSSLGIVAFIWRFNFRNMSEVDLLKRHVLIPCIAVHLLFLVGYYTSLIPPVPVAVKKIGVYYDVTKENGDYSASHLRPFWKFWSKGSQDFQARRGDKLIVMLSIFSPSNFNDRVNLKWYLDVPSKGWTLQDTIPLTIMGGREDGFRGYGMKSYYQPGDWRVEVETSDGREVGRIKLSVTTDDSVDEREFKQDIF